jgi:hypothetical protein
VLRTLGGNVRELTRMLLGQQLLVLPRLALVRRSMHIPAMPGAASILGEGHTATVPRWSRCCMM